MTVKHGTLLLQIESKLNTTNNTLEAEEEAEERPLPIEGK
jgi:hypothetical protein